MLAINNEPEESSLKSRHHVVGPGIVVIPIQFGKAEHQGHITNGDHNLTVECRENVLEQKERKRLAKELQEGILYTVFNCIYLPKKWRLSQSI